MDPLNKKDQEIFILYKKNNLFYKKSLILYSQYNNIGYLALK